MVQLSQLRHQQLSSIHEHFTKSQFHSLVKGLDYKLGPYLDEEMTEGEWDVRCVACLMDNWLFNYQLPVLEVVTC